MRCFDQLRRDHPVHSPRSTTTHQRSADRVKPLFPPGRPGLGALGHMYGARERRSPYEESDQLKYPNRQKSQDRHLGLSLHLDQPDGSLQCRHEYILNTNRSVHAVIFLLVIGPRIRPHCGKTPRLHFRSGRIPPFEAGGGHDGRGALANRASPLATSDRQGHSHRQSVLPHVEPPLLVDIVQSMRRAD